MKKKKKGSSNSQKKKVQYNEDKQENIQDSGWVIGGDGGDEKFQDIAVPQTQRLYSRVKKRDERLQGRHLQEEKEKRKRKKGKEKGRDGMWYI